MSAALKVLAIIPARGGSKGIPGKNIKPLGGKPLIEYSIQAALDANCVNRVMVSTDDNKIADAAVKAGAEVVMRPAEISGDKAPSEAALLHVLVELDQKENYRPDIVVFLQCTSPLTIAEDIDGTVNAMLHEKADSAFSAIRFYHFLWRKDAKNEAEGINHNKSVRPMRQDREEQFLENGAIYAFRTEGFLKSRYRFFGKMAIYEMPQKRCLEIDEPYDFELAQNTLRQYSQNVRSEAIPADIVALVMDFDGVFTDNSVFVMDDGREVVRCHRGDGMGLSMLKKAGVKLFVLSKETNPVLLARCKKLGIPVSHAVEEKLPALKAWSAEQAIPLQKIVYIGNDVNDLECINAVGCGVAVNDSVPEILSAALIVLSAKGGNGALRELSELILKRLQKNINVA
jgi:YrbI family 3-deoxy-D-manno-octulosonate 8-phosphate phosphatase